MTATGMDSCRGRRGLMLAAAAFGLMAATACSVDVREEARDSDKKTVNIRTPMGELSVRTGLEAADTGLAVYPGARPLREERAPESADVNIGSGRFGLKIVATKFRSDAEPEAVRAHYRDAMHAYGDVFECRGDVDFRGRRGNKRPVCRQRLSSREIQLVVGTELNHRMVAIMPRGSGSEFAVVYIQGRS